MGANINGSAAGDLSGQAVSLSFDGSRVAIGSPSHSSSNGSKSGQVKIYDWNGTSWNMVGSPLIGLADSNFFGYNLCISGNGNRLAVSAPYNSSSVQRSGRVTIFDWNGTSWNQIGQALHGTTSWDEFGRGLSISNDGNTLVIGAPQVPGGLNFSQGYVEVYKLVGNTWVQQGNRLLGVGLSSALGFSVGVSHDGSKIIAGSPAVHEIGNFGAGSVQVYAWNGSTYNTFGAAIYGTVADGHTGWAVDMDQTGDVIMFGTPAPSLSIAGWVKTMQLLGFNYIDYGQEFAIIPGKTSGLSVAISADHARCAAGAPLTLSNQGSAVVFKYVPTNPQPWFPLGSTITGAGSTERCGWDIDLSGDGKRVAVGSPLNSTNGTESGHVRVYEFYPTHVDELNTSTAALNIYPNPASSKLHINFQATQNETIELILTDIHGRRFMSQITKSAVGDNTLSIELADNLPNGIYIVQLSDSSGNTTYKNFVVSK